MAFKIKDNISCLQAGPAEPIILEADKSLDTGSIEAITKHVTASVADGIKKRFSTILERKKHATGLMSGNSM